MTNLVFMDWEFSDLGEIGLTCLPISVGMVSVSGEPPLYLEFQILGVCSPFVQTNVLPLLSGDEAVSLEEGASRIIRWLSELSGPTLIAADSNYDFRMVNWVVPKLQERLPVTFANLLDDPTLGQYELAEGMAGRLIRDFDDAMNAWFLRNQKPRHHALNDALTLRSAWMQISGWPK